MWGDGRDEETWTFYPDLLSLVLKYAHHMDMDIMGLGTCMKEIG
jgi:hypothetical protein